MRAGELRNDPDRTFSILRNGSKSRISNKGGGLGSDFVYCSLSFSHRRLIFIDIPDEQSSSLDCRHIYPLDYLLKRTV